MKNSDYKIHPYISTEKAFLGFISDFKVYVESNTNKPYLRNGPKDKISGLRPREILGLILMANLAMFESGGIWVPGWLVDPSGKELPENIALDGVILCTYGEKVHSYMRFEQTMATEVAQDASPNEIESAVIRAIEKKSSKGQHYVRGIALVVLVDYSGVLSNLKKLAEDVNKFSYEAIYLIARVSEDFKDFVCVTLKNPADRHGPISVKFNRRDGKADVKILRK